MKELRNDLLAESETEIDKGSGISWEWEIWSKRKANKPYKVLGGCPC